MSLKFPHRMTPRKLKWTFGCGSGPGERIKRLRMTVTGLIRHERIESTFARCDETRGYAERVCVVTKLTTGYELIIKTGKSYVSIDIMS